MKSTQLRASASQVLNNILRLGSGETVARGCGIITVLFLAHRFGVVVVGVYALSQTMLQYTQPFIDFGMKHVGVRLVARYPKATKAIMLRVQRRRIAMAVALLPLLLAYAASTRVPWNLRVCLLAIAVICPLHALSLDWMAWAQEHFGWAGFGRTIIPIAVLACVLAGRNSANVLWWFVLGHLIGILLHNAILWLWWRSHPQADNDGVLLPDIDDALAWQRTSILGLATLCNLAFNSIDILMLGVMSSPQQVGLYSAAYRVVNQVLYTYYLLTQILYPQLAKQEVLQRTRALRPRILTALAALGTVLAFGFAVARRPIISILFGPAFVGATAMLALLAWAIPMDFLTSYLSNAYIAWAMEKKVLVCIAIAAGANAVLNFMWIPTYGAKAAAVNTLVCYVIFLVSLALAGLYSAELSRQDARAAVNSRPE